MKKLILLMVLWGSYPLMNESLASEPPETQRQLAALNEGGPMVGTDQSTTSFPNSGMNTMPTKQVGTDSHVVNPNAPSTKPGYGGAAAWPTAPAYAPAQPPASTTNTNN